MTSNSPAPYQDAIPNAKWHNCSLIVRSPKYLVCLGEAVKFFFNPISTILLNFSNYYTLNDFFILLFEFYSAFTMVILLYYSFFVILYSNYSKVKN